LSHLAEQGQTKKDSQEKLLRDCGICLQTQKVSVKQRWIPGRRPEQTSPKLQDAFSQVDCVHLLPAAIIQLGCTVATWRKRKISLQEWCRKDNKNCQWIIFPVFSPRTQLLTFLYAARADTIQLYQRKRIT